MHLNGKKYMVKGICCHQDHGGVGAAVTPELMEYRVARLKELGANAYRCAHHAVPDSLLDVCDTSHLNAVLMQLLQTPCLTCQAV